MPGTTRRLESSHPAERRLAPSDRASASVHRSGMSGLRSRGFDVRRVRVAVCGPRTPDPVHPPPPRWPARTAAHRAVAVGFRSAMARATIAACTTPAKRGGRGSKRARLAGTRVCTWMSWHEALACLVCGKPQSGVRMARLSDGPHEGSGDTKAVPAVWWRCLGRPGGVGSFAARSANALRRDGRT